MPHRIEKHQNRLKRNWCFFIFKKSEPNGNSERIPLPAMAGLWEALGIICPFFFDGVYELKVFCAYAFSFFFFVF